MPNKRGQVGETVTWIVATVVIIVILAISILVTSALPKRDKGYLKLIDKQKDFIATKSVVNFLIENFDLVKISVESENYKAIEERFRPFLESLSIFRGSNAGWNFELYIDDKAVKPPIITAGTIGWHGPGNYYHIIFNLDPNTKLKFWEACQGTLCQ